ncbi:MAG: hypothetical protein K2J77_10605 [Oscillospiraceae bacterium]|nr:hypothetical protein [Oscillospiraceae bacterium]
MKIGKFPVKRTYKLARIISDALSLVVAYVIVSSTIHFFPTYKITVNEILNEAWLAGDMRLFYKYEESLAYRQYTAWIFPALVIAVFAAYLILTLTSRKLAKYNITKQNAQAVYDWYAFAVSLCKLPILLALLDAMYIVHQRLMFNKVSVFSVQMILYVVLVVIIIRLSVHRIKAMTKPAAKKEESGGVKAKIVDDKRDDA